MRAHSFRAIDVVFALSMLLAASPREARAQVNAEALRATLRTNPRFLWLEGSLVGRTGNTETLTFSGSTFTGITHEPHLFFTRLSADYGNARGETTVARWMAHARYNYRLTEIVALEALTQVQHDRFRRIGVRDLYGAGLRFDIVRDDPIEVFAGTTYILEHEVIESTPIYPGSNDIWHRSSNYGGVNAKVAPFMDASTVLYVQPRFDAPLDCRVLSDSYVAFTISKVLAARVSSMVWLDSDPPPGVRSFDVEVRNSLVLKLQ